MPPKTTQTDLATLPGSRSRASGLLSGRRGLTMEQVWKLYRERNIPAEVLLCPFV
jgi:antitoxin component HigA of HigAB toxin-antitoxin module